MKYLFYDTLSSELDRVHLWYTRGGHYRRKFFFKKFRRYWHIRQNGNRNKKICSKIKKPVGGLNDVISPPCSIQWVTAKVSTFGERSYMLHFAILKKICNTKNKQNKSVVFIMNQKNPYKDLYCQPCGAIAKGVYYNARSCKERC